MPTRTAGICEPIRAEHPDLHAWTRQHEGVDRLGGARTRPVPAAVGAPALASARAGFRTGPAGWRRWIGCADRGLTNAEIGDRLFLSPRTVASHLYRSYPKLGIAGRHQLHDLIAQTE